MRRIVVRNFGPIEQAEVELNKMSTPRPCGQLLGILTMEGSLYIRRKGEHSLRSASPLRRS